MKRIISQVALIIVAIVLLCAAPVTNIHAQPGYEVSYQTFYDELAPYGQWISDPQYGYVWVPYAEDGFRPYYTRGYWAMTDYGNTWVSEYPWGWATFHYGRWTYDTYYGWVWIPELTWAPSWVTWRHGGGYYGWAPLGPGINISMGMGYDCPEDWWVFIPHEYIYYTGGYYHHYRGPRENFAIINNTTIITNIYNGPQGHYAYFVGPRAHEVQRVTHQPVQVLRLSTTHEHGAAVVNENTVQMYHPEPTHAAYTERRNPIPTNVIRAEQNIGRPQPINVNGGRPAFAAPNQRQPQNDNAIQQHNNPPRTEPQRQPEPTYQQPEPPRGNNNHFAQPQHNDRPQPPMNQQPQRNDRPQQQPEPPRGGNRGGQQMPPPQPQRPQEQHQAPPPPRPQQQAPPRPQPQQPPQPAQHPAPASGNEHQHEGRK